MSDVQSAHELTQATVRGLRWIGVSRLVAELVPLAAMVVLARLIPPAAFGAFAVAVLVQELALGIPAEGIGSALVQRQEVRREHLQAGMALTLLLGIALAGVTLVFTEAVLVPLLGNATASLVALSTPMFVLAALSTVPVALLRRRLDFPRLAIIEIATSVTRALTSLALAGLAGLQGSALVLGGLAAGALGTAIAVISAPVPPPWLRRDAVRDIAGYGAPASLAAVCWAGFRNGDYAVINATLGTTAAGIYWRAYTLAVDYQRKLTVVMYTVAFPVLSRTATRGELFALRRRMVRLLTVVTFPFLTGLAITAPTAIPWLFGPAWQPAVVPTQILSLGGAATLVIDSVGAALMAIGRPRAILAFGVAHFAVYVGSVVVMAPLGLVAVAIDAAIVHGLFLIVAYTILVHGHVERPLRALWHDVGAAVVGCGAMTAVALPTHWLASAAQLPAPVALLAVGAASFVSYLLTIRVFPERWKDLSALVRAMLPARMLRRPATVGPLVGAETHT